MRVIVCGSRRWRDRDSITNRLFDLPGDSTVVHGAAQGADRIAAQEAQKLGLVVEAPSGYCHGYSSPPSGVRAALAGPAAPLCGVLLAYIELAVILTPAILVVHHAWAWLQ